MDRSNPYEAAFEGYLQELGLCHVAVDETRRALWGKTSVKNLDFIVLSVSGVRLLVDVKGRQFPGGPPGKERYVWENWSTEEDLHGMANWAHLFGPGSLGLFVFLYRIGPTVSLPEDTPDLWSFREQRYLLRAVTVADYRARSKPRSRKWGTVCLAGAVFRELARPFRYFSHEFVAEDAFPNGPDPDWRIPQIAQLAVPPGASGSPEARGTGN